MARSVARRRAEHLKALRLQDTAVIAAPEIVISAVQPPRRAKTIAADVEDGEAAREERHRGWLEAVRQFKHSSCETPSEFLNKHSFDFMGVYKNFATQLSRFCHWTAFYDTAKTWTKEGEEVSLENFQKAIAEANKMQAEKKKEKRRLVSLARSLGQPPPKKSRLGIGRKSPHSAELQLQLVVRYRCSAAALYPGNKKSMSGRSIGLCTSDS